MSNISKLITKYMEEFILTCDKDNKDDIIKELKTKENINKLTDEEVCQKVQKNGHICGRKNCLIHNKNDI